MSATVTLDELHRRIIRELYGSRYPLVAYPTATSTTSSFVCGQQAYSSASVNAFDGVWLYLPHSMDTTASGGITSHPKQARVTRGGYTVATGAFAVSPVVAEGPSAVISSASAAAATVVTTSTSHNLATGDQVYVSITGSTPTVSGVYPVTVTAATTFTIPVDLTGGAGTGGVVGRPIYFTYGLPMETVDEAINSVIRTCYLPRFLPLGTNYDGDNEATGVGSWPAVGSGTTITKSSTRAIGTQSLSVITTVVDTGAENSLTVTEAEQYIVSALVSVSAGSLRVALYDSTNSEEIDGVTVDQGAWTEVRFVATIPDNCEAATVRVTSKTASTTASVNYAVALPTHNEVMDLAQSATLSGLNAADILGVFHQPVGFPSEANQSYVGWPDEALEPWSWSKGMQDYAAGSSHWLNIQNPCYNPLWIQFRAIDSVLAPNAGDTDTTFIPVEVLVPGAVAECHRKLGNDEKAREYTRQYLAALAGIGLGAPTVTREPQRRVMAP